ncbi:MAG: hypothetical protein CNE99_04205 [OM182 bacterium MED-G24]|uniref:SH3b domain-containing protein n=1 Tax=OM182 bacterium MED-G24 TaxID=1986255 RepID=A0A2A5WUA0_9GAMM|nr:MAG: hypothetical protein CNE99_04205 [OM182 bacterium MED-G24]
MQKGAALKRLLCVAFVAGITLTVPGTPVYADRVYIRDTLYVPLRGGQGQEYRILHRGLRSGTALTRLEDNPETGYSLVRMEDGLEGWIQTQYISLEPVAALKLAATISERDALKSQYDELQARVQQTMAVREQLSEDNDRLAQEQAGLSRELQRISELAADTISIDQQNQSLVSEQEDLNQQIDRLMIETAALESSENQEWFLTGGGVVLLGLLFGFLFGRKIYHRRGSGW